MKRSRRRVCAGALGVSGELKAAGAKSGDTSI